MFLTVVRGGVVRLRDLLPPRSRTRAGRVPSRARPRWHARVSTWGAEDERWAWEDELLADVVVERRAVQRPFDRPDDLEALLRNAGFDDVAVRSEQHECNSPTPTSGGRGSGRTACAGSLEQLPQPRLERLRAEAEERIAAMSAGGGLPLRLEALIAVAIPEPLQGTTSSSRSTPIGRRAGCRSKAGRVLVRRPGDLRGGDGEPGVGRARGRR